MDDIEFTQTISLVKSGSSEHGMAYISYTAQNKGEEAQIRARILMDTALGYQDYATTISAVIPSLNRKQHWVRMDITNPFMDIMIRFPQPLLPIL